MTEYERDVALALRRVGGARVIGDGWPDLLVMAKGATFGVELKRGSDRLRPSQETMHAALAEIGLRTLVVREAHVPRLVSQLRQHTHAVSALECYDRDATECIDPEHTIYGWPTQWRTA